MLDLTSAHWCATFFSLITVLYFSIRVQKEGLNMKKLLNELEIVSYHDTGIEQCYKDEQPDEAGCEMV